MLYLYTYPRHRENISFSMHGLCECECDLSGVNEYRHIPRFHDIPYAYSVRRKNGYVMNK